MTDGPLPAPGDETESPSRRRRRFRRRRFFVFGALTLVILLGAYTLGVGIAPLPAAAAAATPSRTITPPKVEPAFPPWGSAAVSAVGHKGMLVQNGSTASVPIASMTKTITALVVLQKHPLTASDDGPTITFTQSDVDILHDVLADGGSWAPVVAGEQLTERQTLEAMLLPSANNYAISLSIWAFGSQQAFLSAAAAWVSAHGLTGTRVTDPAGLDAGSVSTPEDLVEIGKLVVANPVLASIVKMPTVTLPGAGTQENTNDLLGEDGVDGIKTGSTTQAGFCLLFSASVTIDGHHIRLVGVVTGGSSFDDLWTYVPPLLKSVEAGYHTVGIDTSADYGGYTTVWGQSARLRSTGSGGVFVFSDQPVTVTVRTETPTAAKPGEGVGSVTYSSGGSSVRRTLTVSRPLTDPGLGWRFTHPLLLM